MQSVTNADVNGKKVIVRGDLDLAEENGKPETFRLLRMIPTLKDIISRGGAVRLLAHRGRPKGQVVDSLSLKEYVPLLSEQLGTDINFAGDPLTSQSPDGRFVLFENLRFHTGEEDNDPEFIQQLVKLGELYVNECFSTSHRDQASFTGIPKFLPHFAGLNLLKEVEELTKVLDNPEHPLAVIIGGAKLETKRPTIDFMADRADHVLVGSSFASQGLQATDKIVVPTDFVGETKDIGSTTVNTFKNLIAAAKMIVWNGPLGEYEDPQFAAGTRSIAQAIVSSSAYSVVGGGDTIAALDEMGLLDKISFVSTGGGAMLDFLSGQKLPGLVALG